MERPLTIDLMASRYRVIRSLGRGAMGEVFLVEDTTSGQEVALKRVAAEAGGGEKTLLQFQREFRLMTGLRHANCCAVYDYGLLDCGSPYFTMELVPGRDLGEILPVDAETFISVLSQLLMALDYLHERGLVHRDIKAANVRVRPDGVVKLMDYGLVEYAGSPGGAPSGTLPYMAPEVLQRGPVDPRADLYSLGCLAYELLTGAPPFASTRPIEVARAHVQELPEPPSRRRAGLEPATDALVMKLLAKEPQARYQSAFRVLDAMGIALPRTLGGLLLSPPMVGREDDLQALAERLRAVAAGAGAPALWIYGPPGSGKSRLVDAFRCEVQLAGLPCVQARSHEGGGVPYAPIVEVLRGLLPVLRTHHAEALEALAPDLVALLPELDCPPALAVDPAADRRRLHAAVAKAIGWLAAAGGLVIWLDDCQWLDPASNACLEYLLSRSVGSAVFYVLTSRHAPSGPPAMMAALRTRRLARLEGEAIAEIIAAMLGAERVDADFVERVAAFSDGTPLFVESLLEHLVQTGALTHRAGEWRTDIALSAESLPLNLQAMLARQLEALPAHARDLAALAALRDRESPLEFFARAAGLPDDALFEALAELQRQAIVARTPGGGYRFARDAFREYLLTQLNADERQGLHLRVARALEATLGDLAGASAPVDMLLAIAGHYQQADDLDQTIAHALEAGLRLKALHAPRDAERFFKAGLAAIRRSGDPRHRRRELDYHCHLGSVRLSVGQLAGAKQAYLAALPLAEAFGETFLQGRMLGSLALVAQHLDDVEAGLAYGSRATDMCLAAGDLAGAAYSLVIAGRIHLYQGRLPLALADLDRALVLARDAGDGRLVGEAQALMGYLALAYDPNSHEAGLGRMVEAADQLVARGDRLGLKNVHNWLGNAHMVVGDYPAARAAYTESERLCRELEHSHDGGLRRINLAVVSYEMGDFAAALALARGVREGARSVGNKYQLGASLAIEAAAAAHVAPLGDPAAAFDEAIALARTLQNRLMETLVSQYQFEALLHLHDLARAEATAETLGALLAETGTIEQRSRFDVLMGELCGRQGDEETARAHLARALVGAVRVRGVRLRALVALAARAIAAGAWLEARQAAEEGLTLARLLEARYHQADLHGLAGEIALATGMPGADDHFRAMADLAASLGTPDALARARFGLAAARPYDPAARQLVASARAGLEALAGALTPASASAFLGHPARRRVLAGDHFGFALPVAGAQAQRLPRGLWRQAW